MQWLKTWLRKWLGIEQLAETDASHIQSISDLTRRFDILCGEVVKIGPRIDNLREGSTAAARAIRGDMDEAYVRHVEDRKALRAELVEIIKSANRDDERISALEVLVKDATLDTVIAALEDRVAKIESASPATQNGRRGGSAWGPHQVAAAAGAARASGSEVPIKVPGVS